MAVSLKHAFASAKPDGTDTTLIQPSNWNAEHTLTMATNRILGRTTAGTGVAEEISIGSGLTFSSTTLSLSGTLSITTLDVSGDVNLNGTGAVKVPTGTTAQRPSPATGDFRFNTSTAAFEGYNGSAWGSIGGGATGGSGDQVFYLNSQTVTTTYSIPSGQNANCVGPITVNSGVTVTVPSGSRWVVL
jgi:hypothetical protein